MTGKTTRTIVAISDIQAPLHDKKAVATVVKFLRDFQPDECLVVGDEYDLTQVSRWDRGTAVEYSGKLQQDLDDGYAVLQQLRDAAGHVPFHVVRSNHTDRFERYIRSYAPALSSLRGLNWASVARYRELGFTYHDSLYEFTPGWWLAHGDESGLSSIAGMTARKLSDAIGASVVCGHTHRLGIIPKSVGSNGKVTATYGVETGNLMKLQKAHYLMTRAANWQQGISVLYVDSKKRVTPTVIPIREGRMVVEGVEYS